MATSIKQRATTDAYQEIRCPNTSRVTMQVFNAAVDIGFGIGTPPAAQYLDPDETYAPVNAGLERDCDAIRFKSALPGVPAIVNIAALTDNG